MLNKKLISQAATALQSKNTNEQGKKMKVNSQVVALVGTARILQKAMAQGGIGGAARVVRGPRAKKPAPVVPDEHVPVPMVPAEHRTLLVQGLTPQISDELLELYFENPKCGGGEIESIHREDEDKARVVFKEDLVVEDILEHGNHRLRDADLFVTRVPVEEINIEQKEEEEANSGDEENLETAEEVTANAILVGGLHPSTDKEVLQLFFENTKRSGGGEIKDIQMYQDSGRAIIWFAETTTVENVLQKGPLSLAGSELTIVTYVEEPMVKISGVTQNISEETLELYFENTKRSGGGEIKSIDMFPSMQAAIITFEDTAVADRVVDKYNFTLSKCELVAERFFGLKPNDKQSGPPPKESPGRKVNEQSKKKRGKGGIKSERRPVEEKIADDGEASPESSSDEHELESCSIEVSGVNKETSQETLKMFFENRRKSGGGQIEDVWFNKSNGNYIITFKNREAVNRVKKRQHKLESAELKITVKEAACQRGPQLTGGLELNRVYVTGLNEKISRDQLELHMEGSVNCEVVDVVYGLDPSVAMVTCKNKIKYRALRRAFSRKHIQGCMLGLYQVPRPTCIQVSNIGDISEDSLSAYFETKRSGGSGDVDVVIHQDQGCAIVTLDSYEILQNVLSRPKHRHEGLDLQLCVYRERLGIIPTTHDTSQPCVQIPNDVIVKDMDRNKVHFLKTFPAARKHAEEGVMKKLYAKIDWDHKSDTELHVMCTLRNEDKDVRNLAKDWNEAVKESLQYLFSTIKVERRECLKKTWKDVCFEVQKIRKGSPGIAVIKRDDESSLYVVGKAETVKKIYQQVDKMCDEIEQKLEHMKDTIDLQDFERAVFLKTNQKQKLDKRYPKVRITLRQVDIEVEGPPKDLLCLQKELTSFLRNIHQRKLSLSKGQLKVLTMLQRQQHNKFNNSLQKLEVVMQVDGDNLMLFGGEKDIDKCNDLLKNTIKETTIEVSKEEQTALKESIWKDLPNTLFMRYSGIIHLELENNSSVNLVTQADDFNGALEEVKNHIRKNAMREVYVELEIAETRMIMQWMTDEIKKIEGDFERYNVRITAQDDYGFVITGTEDGIFPAKTRTEKLTEKIITDRHTVTTPGMPYYFTQDVGKYFLKSQEDRYQVVIHHEDPNQERKSLERRRRPIPQPRSSTVELEQTTHSSGVKIKIIVGDMTSHKVDAIVNAANAKLAHVGGLAKAIADKGGRTIQTESDEHVRQYGPVMEGHAVLTGAGKLPCKKIIHAVGPHWNGGRIGEEDILYDCVFSHILMITFQENFSSVAIPAISAGVFGFPLVKSTAIIVEAVKDFLDQMNQGGNLSEIHLLDNRQEGGQAFVTALKKRFKITQPAAPPIPSRRLPNNSGVRAQRVRPQGNQNTFRTNEGLLVTLKIGTIASEQVDIIFNTTAQGLNLNSGAISKSIITAAGNGIQMEVSQKCPNGLQTGQHVISSGGNLSCSEIFHAVLCNWDNGQGSAQKLLKNIVINSLNYGSQRVFQSIALPAMGTGNLQFPRDVVANTMFDSVIEFSRANPNTTLKDVRFVLFNKDQPTIDAFEDHLSTLTGNTNTGFSTVGNVGKRKVYKGGDSVINEPLVGAVGGIPEPFELLEPMAGSAFVEPNSMGATGGPGGEIKIGSIRLQVVPGDITKENTDAIVNGTNPDLDMTQGAVSKAIASAAGARLTQECQFIGPIQSNGVVTTSGGNLTAKHVIHLDVQGITSKGEWKKGITRCLQQAESNELSSISFPALGTGMLKISPSKMALALMEAIAEFSKKNTNSTISLVRVVIFQEEMVATYLDQMEKATNASSSIMGMVTAPFRYIGNTIKSFLTKGGYADDKQVKHGVVPIAVEKSAATLDFTILGLKRENIEATKKAIQSCCQKESADIIIAGPEYSEIIKFLDQFKIEELENVGNRIGVKMTIDLGHRTARIRLQGQSKDVYQADSRIKEILHKTKAELMEQQEAVMLAQFVQWECKEPNNQYQAYPAEINTKLEKAYQKGDTIVDWKEQEASGNIVKWKVDLQAKKETDGTVTKEVHRRVIAEKGVTMDVPKNWTKMTGSEVFELVQLSNTDPEYTTVSQAFQRTCQRQIVKIERMQNKYLYRRYMVHKEDMDRRNPPGTQNELKLWHGTASTSVNSINTNGFNRSYCGQHGVAYGQGVYFAVNAQYSTGYSKPDANGICQMYYARVLTGQPAQGNSAMKTPPSKNDPKNQSLHYDSTVDRQGAPSMYVIYYDTQAYPEYIVSFR